MTDETFNKMEEYRQKRKPFIVKGKSGQRLFCPSSKIFNFDDLWRFIGLLESKEPISIIAYECGAEDVTHCPLYSPDVVVQKCEDRSKKYGVEVEE